MYLRSKKLRAALLRLVDPLGLDVGERTPREELLRLLRVLGPLEAPLIRIGPAGDGGYLVPDDLEGIRYAFSPGVSTQSGFEAELAERGMQVFLADHSVDGPAQPHPNFSFVRKFVGCVSNEQFMTLDEWKQQSIGDYRGDLLLQMDIEGCEYETLLSSSAALLAQFRIMVIEIHFLEQWLNRYAFGLVSRAFDKLAQTHSVVHLHPNNCCGSVRTQGLVLPRVMELTLLRKDRIGERKPALRFPHPLDADNTGKATLVLPRCWYAR
ncbi:MAG: FkbM family methyltransferase [Woeseiaceae bacterium]